MQPTLVFERKDERLMSSQSSTSLDAAVENKPKSLPLHLVTSHSNLPFRCLLSAVASVSKWSPSSFQLSSRLRPGAIPQRGHNAGKAPSTRAHDRGSRICTAFPMMPVAPLHPHGFGSCQESIVQAQLSSCEKFEHFSHSEGV